MCTGMIPTTQAAIEGGPPGLITPPPGSISPQPMTREQFAASSLYNPQGPQIIPGSVRPAQPQGQTAGPFAFNAIAQAAQGNLPGANIGPGFAGAVPMSQLPGLIRGPDRRAALQGLTGSDRAAAARQINMQNRAIRQQARNARLADRQAQRQARLAERSANRATRNTERGYGPLSQSDVGGGAVPAEAGYEGSRGGHDGYRSRRDSRNAREGYMQGERGQFAGRGAIPATPAAPGGQNGQIPPAVPQSAPPATPSPFSAQFPSELTMPWGNATPQSSKLRSNLSSFLSDRDAKTDISHLSDEAALAKIASVPVYKYKYKKQFRDGIGDRGEQRVGPMAQDWAREFGGPPNVIPMPQMVGALVGAVRALEKRTSQKDKK